MWTKIKMDIKQLMCRLTEDELEEQGKILTELLQSKMDLEIQKSSNAKHFTDLIKANDVQIEKQIPIVRDRQIERSVECRTEFNTPEPGKKTITRLDTMEVIFEGQMTDSECQDLFINNGADEADEADDENAQGQKLLAAPIDAEEVIRFDIYGEDDGKEEILINGNLYEVNGKLYKAIPAYDCCKGCAFDNGDVNCHCDCIANSVILTPADIPTGEVTGIGDGEDMDEADETVLPAEADQPTEKEETKRPVVCGTCGHPGELYHLAQGKQICSRCLVIKNQKNLDKIKTVISEKQEIQMRPVFGFGVVPESADLTCFRFMIGGKTGGKGSSWGTPVYLPGDYRTEGTDAAIYFNELSELGIKEG